jgi:sRNA-binding carbon storage regulator CsrA
VTVAAVNGQRVRLGVTAPHSVRVVRLELLADDSRSQKSRMAEGRPSRDAQGQSLIAQCGRNE